MCGQFIRKSVQMVFGIVEGSMARDDDHEGNSTNDFYLVDPSRMYKTFIRYHTFITDWI